MKIFTNKEFLGHWPVGTAAVVVAEDKEQAKQMLEEKLIQIGLSQKVELEHMEELPIEDAAVRVLEDGTY